MFRAVVMEQRASDLAFTPFLKVADPKNAEGKKEGRCLVYEDYYIAFENDAYAKRPLVGDMEIDRRQTKQVRWN